MTPNKVIKKRGARKPRKWFLCVFNKNYNNWTYFHKKKRAKQFVKQVMKYYKDVKGEVVKVKEVK